MLARRVLNAATMRLPSLLPVVLLALAPLPGCNGQLGVGGAPIPRDQPMDPAGDPGGDPAGNPNDPGCPDGTHLSDGRCIADEVTCATEFPCPDGQQCVSGHCVALPGPCKTNDDCPSAYLCVNGMCAQQCEDKNPQCTRDADCGPDMFCVACACVGADRCQRPTADLSGQPFTALQDLHLDQALGAFGKSFAGILTDVRDGIQGCPPGSSNNCWVLSLLSGFLPNYARTLIVVVADFADLLDNKDFLVHSQMTFARSGKPSSYTGTDHWTLLEFSYHHMKVMKRPEDVKQINKPVNVPFTASAVCGVLYVDKHKVDGVLSGILKWLLDTVVEIETCQINNGPCFHTLGEAIDAALDCNVFIPGNLVAFGICQNVRGTIKKQLDDALNQWLLSYSLMTLKGTADVEGGGASLDHGRWDGTIGNGIGLFHNFSGEWAAKR